MDDRKGLTKVERAALTADPRAKLHDTATAAYLLGISPRTILKYLKAGRLEAINLRTGGNAAPLYRFRESDLIAYLDRKQGKKLP